MRIMQTFYMRNYLSFSDSMNMTLDIDLIYYYYLLECRQQEETFYTKESNVGTIRDENIKILTNSKVFKSVLKRAIIDGYAV